MLAPMAPAPMTTMSAVRGRLSLIVRPVYGGQERHDRLESRLKSYVDPQLPKIGYGDLLSARDPQPLLLTMAFHRNGSPASLGASRARDEVRTVLEHSKLFPAVVMEKSTAPGGQLDVVLDNVGDLNDAAAKGAKTGLTFGASGSQVTDGYVFTATFRPVGKPPVTKVPVGGSKGFRCEAAPEGGREA